MSHQRRTPSPSQKSVGFRDSPSDLRKLSIQSLQNSLNLSDIQTTTSGNDSDWEAEIDISGTVTPRGLPFQSLDALRSTHSPATSTPKSASPVRGQRFAGMMRLFQVLQLFSGCST